MKFRVGKTETFQQRKRMISQGIYLPLLYFMPLFVFKLLEAVCYIFFVFAYTSSSHWYWFHYCCFLKQYCFQVTSCSSSFLLFVRNIVYIGKVTVCICYSAVDVRVKENPACFLFCFSQQILILFKMFFLFQLVISLPTFYYSFPQLILILLLDLFFFVGALVPTHVIKHAGHSISRLVEWDNILCCSSLEFFFILPLEFVLPMLSFCFILLPFSTVR